MDKYFHKLLKQQGLINSTNNPTNKRKIQQSLSHIYRDFDNLTDKGTTHSYINYYESLFNKLRNKPIYLLEIGVFHGGSILLWHRYFEKAKIFGIDVQLPNKPFPSRVSLFKENATNPNSILAQGNVLFDVIIDDGSHILNDQLSSLKIFWPKLKPKGIYIIEDIQNKSYLNIFSKLKFNFMSPIEIIDFTNISFRHDDILAIWRKQ